MQTYFTLLSIKVAETLKSKIRDVHQLTIFIYIILIHLECNTGISTNYALLKANLKQCYNLH